MPRRNRNCPTASQARNKLKKEKWCNGCRSFHGPWYYITLPVDPNYPDAKSKYCIVERFKKRIAEELKDLGELEQPKDMKKLSNEEKQLLVLAKAAAELRNWFKELAEIRKWPFLQGQLVTVWTKISKRGFFEHGIVERFNARAEWLNINQIRDRTHEEGGQHDGNKRGQAADTILYQTSSTSVDKNNAINGEANSLPFRIKPE